MFVYIPSIPSTDETISHEQMLPFSEPSVNELPSITPGAIRCLFKKLSLANILKILNLILRFSIIRVVGHDRNEIFLCCEALRNLVFPFKPVPRSSHTMVYIPYIPLRAYTLVDCISPSLIGFHDSLIGKVYFSKSTHVV